MFNIDSLLQDAGQKELSRSGSESFTNHTENTRCVPTPFYHVRETMQHVTSILADTEFLEFTLPKIIFLQKVKIITIFILLRTKIFHVCYCCQHFSSPFHVRCRMQIGIPVASTFPEFPNSWMRVPEFLNESSRIPESKFPNSWIKVPVWVPAEILQFLFRASPHTGHGGILLQPLPTVSFFSFLLCENSFFSYSSLLPGSILFFSLFFHLLTVDSI